MPRFTFRPWTSLEIDDTLKGLTAAAPRLRAVLGREIRTKYTPELAVQSGHRGPRRVSASKRSCASLGDGDDGLRRPRTTTDRAMATVPDGLNDRFPDLERAGRVSGGSRRDRADLPRRARWRRHGQHAGGGSGGGHRRKAGLSVFRPSVRRSAPRCGSSRSSCWCHPTRFRPNRR